jgi:GDPmannose 4,6-dehydratase
MNKVALIVGVSGQDGAYLGKLLLEKGYRVVGTSRDAGASNFRNLERLKIKNQVTLTSMSLNDFRSVLQVIDKYEPSEIYNLAGQTSVGLSFDQPVETMESISKGVLNLLEAVRFSNRRIKIYNAGSSEVFGDTGDGVADEQTIFKPRSPYAVAKAAAYWQVENYREAYDIFACTGLLFNHESSLRPQRFVTQKIINGVKEILEGHSQKISLGNLEITRDWGWSPEYVEAMWLMLQVQNPGDYVIATGTSHSLEYFVDVAFRVYDMDWRQYVVVDPTYFRPLDIKVSRGNPSKAKKILGWQAKTKIDQIVSKMTEGVFF